MLCTSRRTEPPPSRFLSRLWRDSSERSRARAYAASFVWTSSCTSWTVACGHGEWSHGEWSHSQYSHSCSHEISAEISTEISAEISTEISAEISTEISAEISAEIRCRCRCAVPR